MTQAAQKQVQDIIQTRDVPMTVHTVDWLDALYEAGATRVDPDGTVRLDPKVRDVVRAMHAVLAGAKVDIRICAEGGPVFEKLEDTFTAALEESLTAVTARRDVPGRTAPYVP